MIEVVNPFSVLLVDDQSIILDGIESLLAPIGQVKVVGRANNGIEAVRMAKELKPDLVIMDVNMPGMDGIEATRHVRTICPDSKVVALSMYGHKEFVLELMDAGAYGYLLKNTGKAELLEALATVADGGKYVSRELRPVLNAADRFKDRTGENGYSVLTKREIQVVKLIVQERTTQEIATALFLSPDTVETHRRNIMHKLDVRNIAGLVKYAIERGWGE